MIKITKSEFTELCRKEKYFTPVIWPKRRRKINFLDFTKLCRNAGIPDHDIQFVIWKFDIDGWEKAEYTTDTQHVDNYLNDEQMERD